MKFDFFLELKLCTVIGMQACRIVALHYTTKDRQRQLSSLTFFLKCIDILLRVTAPMATGFHQSGNIFWGIGDGVS